MKIKTGFEIKKVSDKYIVVPNLEQSINFNGIISLNSSAKLLFEALNEEQTIESLTNILFNTYDIDVKKAEEDVLKFLKILKENNLLDE